MRNLSALTCSYLLSNAGPTFTDVDITFSLKITEAMHALTVVTFAREVVFLSSALVPGSPLVPTPLLNTSGTFDSAAISTHRVCIMITINLGIPTKPGNALITADSDTNTMAQSLASAKCSEGQSLIVILPCDCCA
jgi:hypothetical protein